MALQLIYMTFTRVLGWMVLLLRSDTAKEIEILVLRHQLAGLQRRTLLSDAPDEDDRVVQRDGLFGV